MKCATHRCMRKVFSRGYCSSCYQSIYKEEKKLKKLPGKMCLFDDCTQVVFKRGSCKQHQEINPLDDYFKNRGDPK